MPQALPSGPERDPREELAELVAMMQAQEGQGGAGMPPAGGGLSSLMETGPGPAPGSIPDPGALMERGAPAGAASDLELQMLLEKLNGRGGAGMAPRR